METLYVWLFIFAGTTLVVLGILLLVSERELKKQRRELDELRRMSDLRGSGFRNKINDEKPRTR